MLKFVCKNYFNWDGQKDKQGRSIIQKIGTDIIREQNPNYWVDFIISILQMFPNEWDYILIPDCRFKNELEKLSGFDTINLRVNRLNFQSPLTLEQQKHISETALDNYEFDYVINSENGLDKLEVEVKKFMGWLEGECE